MDAGQGQFNSSMRKIERNDIHGRGFIVAPNGQEE